MASVFKVAIWRVLGRGWCRSWQILREVSPVQATRTESDFTAQRPGPLPGKEQIELRITLLPKSPTSIMSLPPHRLPQKHSQPPAAFSLPPPVWSPAGYLKGETVWKRKIKPFYKRLIKSHSDGNTFLATAKLRPSATIAQQWHCRHSGHLRAGTSQDLPFPISLARAAPRCHGRCQRGRKTLPPESSAETSRRRQETWERGDL